MTNHFSKDRVLRVALSGNAWFYLVLGVAAFLAARPIADVVGLTGAIGAPGALALVFGTGALLGIGGAALYATSQRAVLDRWLAGVATGVNAMWVVATVLLFAVVGPAIPGAGRWLLGGVAQLFAAFAAVEAFGLWRAATTAEPRSGHGSASMVR